MRDDILGIVGTEAKLGKPVGSDIREGKKTLIVRAALLNASEADAALLRAILGKKDATNDEVALATRLLRDNGGIDYVHNLAVHYIDKARPRLDVLPDTPSTNRLHQWAQYMIDRAY